MADADEFDLDIRVASLGSRPDPGEADTYTCDYSCRGTCIACGSVPSCVTCGGTCGNTCQCVETVDSCPYGYSCWDSCPGCY